MVTNEKIALMLEEIAQLLELEGERSGFRIASYYKSAKAIRYHPQLVIEMEDPTIIHGVGDSTAAKIKEIQRTGSIRYLDDFRQKWPASVLELTRVRGIGPKKAFKIYQDHGIKNFAELVDAVQNRGLLSDLKDKVEFSLKESQSGYPLQEVDPIALMVVKHMMELQPHVLTCEVVGSYRRRKAEVRDLDIIVCANEGGMEIHSHFLGLGKTLASGGQKSRIMFDNSGIAIQIDLLVVPSREYGTALNYFTGSAAYNSIIRGYARQKGFTVNEHGIFRLVDGEAGERVGGEKEDDLYNILGLPFCPPEFREEENGLLTKIPDNIVTLEDIDQDIHCHTTYSDGSASVGEMVEAAKSYGLDTIGISDHIANSNYGYKLRDLGVHYKRMSDIRNARALVGAEIDVDGDGNLECSPEILSDLDYVIAALHDSYDKNILERISKVIQNKKVVAIAHPTGRLRGVRPPAETDWDSVFSLLSAQGVALEINGQSDRMDLSVELIRKAMKHGCKFIISSDAHDTFGFSNLKYGLYAARRAMVTSDMLLRL